VIRIPFTPRSSHDLKDPWFLLATNTIADASPVKLIGGEQRWWLAASSLMIV
jgi:hypothetical protein